MVLHSDCTLSFFAESSLQCLRRIRRSLCKRSAICLHTRKSLARLTELLREFEEDIRNRTKAPGHFMTLSKREALRGRLVRDTDAVCAKMRRDGSAELARKKSISRSENS